MADSIKTACGQKSYGQMLAQAMSYGGGDCPDCGRKIEVTHE